MPHHKDEEEHKEGGAGRHGKGHDDEGHGKPGHKHEEGEGRHGKHGHGGEDDDSDHDDHDEEDENDEANEEEAKHPGWKKAGRVASRKWKRQNGVDPKTHMKDLTPEQRKEIRVAKRTARRHFVSAHEKD